MHGWAHKPMKIYAKSTLRDDFGKAAEIWFSVLPDRRIFLHSVQEKKGKKCQWGKKCKKDYFCAAGAKNVRFGARSAAKRFWNTQSSSFTVPYFYCDLQFLIDHQSVLRFTVPQFLHFWQEKRSPPPPIRPVRPGIKSERPYRYRDV
mgnify:CR=1 FL=1